MGKLRGKSAYSVWALSRKLILEHFVSWIAGLNFERDNETVCCFKAIP